MKTITQFISQSKKLLIIVAELPLKESQFVQNFLIQCNCPMIIEPLSQLRNTPELQPKISNDNTLKITQFTHVLRLGGMPVTSLWRQLAKQPTIHTLSVSHLPFNGLPHGQLITSDYTNLKGSCQQVLPNQNWRISRQKTIDQTPNSEPHMIDHLSRHIPNNAIIYLGNSSPIRTWGSYASYTNNSFQIYASRGVNGIDGQLSTFLGIASPKIENWCILGDLTTLYDLSAPWILPQLAQFTLRIVIINNHGGQLFAEKFPNHPELINTHNIDFDHWAALWKIKITTITDITTLNQHQWEKHHIIVLKPQKYPTTHTLDLTQP